MARKDTDSDSDNLLPPLEDLTQEQANRIVCADYLRSLADLIQNGAMGAFELAWSSRSGNKPVGRLVTDASFLLCPAEIELKQKIEHIKKTKISVEDWSDTLKTADPDKVS